MQDTRFVKQIAPALRGTSRTAGALRG